jgi:hypothetical protein
VGEVAGFAVVTFIVLGIASSGRHDFFAIVRSVTTASQ